MSIVKNFILGLALVFGLSQMASAAVYTVTKIADTNDGTCDSDCSLREAVAAANATADNDTIIFSGLFNSPQTITLGGSEIIIANNGSLTIFGTGADKVTISGNNASRIFATSVGVTAIISNARFTGGNGAGAANTGRAGAIYNNGGNLTLNNLVLTGNTANTGGATNNAGTATLTVNNCYIFNNTSASSGGAMQNFGGNTLIINNSTLSGNTSGGATGGGAIQANGTLNISNSTFSGNNAPGGSGGAITFNGTAINFNNVTMVGNTATNNGGGFHRTGANPVTFRNTIISGNTGVAGSPDITGAITSNGNNIIGNVGTSTGWVMSDLQNTNPVLSPLGFYGGIGQTYALLTTSPALNAGQSCVTDLSCAANNPPVAITADQRGATRTNVDIGAFEDSANYRAVLPSATNNSAYNQTITADVGSFTYSQMGGTLPSGVTVNTGGVIANVSGTPTQAGVFDFGVNIAGTNSALVNYRLYVSPAKTSISGRVITSGGAPLGRTYVTLTSNTGTVIRTSTNAFGYYRFDDLNIGEVYQISVASKIYTFTNSPQFLLVNDAVNNADFTVAP